MKKIENKEKKEIIRILNVKMYFMKNKSVYKHANNTRKFLLNYLEFICQIKKLMIILYCTYVRYVR